MEEIDVTSKYKDMLVKLANDLALERRYSKKYNISKLIRKREDSLINDIILFEELEFYLRNDKVKIIMQKDEYEDLYNTALEDVVKLSKENTKLKSENIRLKDVNANLENVNANLNLEKGRLQGNLAYKNQRLKEYEKQLDLSKSKLETEIKDCEEALKHCNRKADTDRIKTLNERIMLCRELLGG